MFGSLSLGRILGIQIRCSWTFLLLLPLILRLRSTPLASLLLFAALFLSVLMHELGHALVARRFGIHVIDITFWPLGGMARMSEIPEVPRVEGSIALAGPAVNGVLAVLSALVLLLGMALGGPAGEAIALGGGAFAAINAALGGFNLLPAFPMDGGRVLRCWFARRTSWVEATARAVAIGRWVALAMVVTAFLVPQLSLFVMILVALFVWMMGSRELLSVRLRHGLAAFAKEAFGGPEQGDATRPAEWAELESSRAEAAKRRASTPSDEEEPANSNGRARRPTDWDGTLGSGGFTDDDVRALERYRGPLPRE